MLFQIVGLIAGLVQVVGYIDYISLVRRGEIESPNTGSWVIWSYGNAMVCWTYIIGGELRLEESLPFVCSIACFLTGFYFLIIGKFKKPKTYEVIILLVDIAITIYWIVCDDTVATQILLQISVIASFAPIIKETYADPSSEIRRPWVIWSIAYTLLLFAEWPSSELWKLIYPINYIIWHGIMAILAKPRPSKH